MGSLYINVKTQNSKAMNTKSLKELAMSKELAIELHDCSISLEYMQREACKTKVGDVSNLKRINEYLNYDICPMCKVERIIRPPQYDGAVCTYCRLHYIADPLPDPYSDGLLIYVMTESNLLGVHRAMMKVSERGSEIDMRSSEGQWL